MPYRRKTKGHIHEVLNVVPVSQIPSQMHYLMLGWLRDIGVDAPSVDPQLSLATGFYVRIRRFQRKSLYLSVWPDLA